jgi:hypothetical protein
MAAVCIFTCSAPHQSGRVLGFLTMRPGKLSVLAVLGGSAAACAYVALARAYREPSACCLDAL